MYCTLSKDGLKVYFTLVLNQLFYIKYKKYIQVYFFNLYNVLD